MNVFIYFQSRLRSPTFVKPYHLKTFQNINLNVPDTLPIGTLFPLFTTTLSIGAAKLQLLFFISKYFFLYPKKYFLLLFHSSLHCQKTGGQR
jgi:hypothetical protein